MEVAPCCVLADAGSFFYCLNLEVERYGIPHNLADDRDGLSSFYRLIVDLSVEGRVFRVWNKLHAIL